LTVPWLKLETKKLRQASDIRMRASRKCNLQPQLLPDLDFFLWDSFLVGLSGKWFKHQLFAAILPLLESQ